MAVQDGAEQAATPAMGQLMTTVAAQAEPAGASSFEQGGEGR
jgi:hypothetical protein